MKVFSYTAPAEPEMNLGLPCDARILSFQLTVTNPVIELFMLGDETGPTSTRTFQLVRTGEEFWESYTYLGSFHDHTGVSHHLFETFPNKGA